MCRLGSTAAALGLSLALASCGSKGHVSSSSSSSTSGGCTRVASPAPRTAAHLRAPAARLPAGHSYRVHMTTNCGEIVIALDVRRSPRTSASFAYLVSRHFYDGLTFQRVVPGFVIQGGDPLGTGRGGPGYTVIERPPRGLRYTRGSVAMAKTQVDPPGASGSQFFIVTAADAGLPADYALIGQVTAGSATVSRIGAVPVGGTSGDQPQLPVVIEKATLQTLPSGG